MSVYICRHADKQSTHPFSALSEMGKTHAIMLGNELRKDGIYMPYILSSSYDRCLETASAISLGMGHVPIFVEYGLSEGPQPPPPHTHMRIGSSEMQSIFPLLDTTRPSKTMPPHGEYTQQDVLPRCVEMGRFASKFYASKKYKADVIFVTHGTVAIGMVAAMAQQSHESLNDSLSKVQGCVAAGFYRLTPYMHAKDGIQWKTDFKCHSSHLPNQLQEKGTITTPTCYVSGSSWFSLSQPRVPYEN